MAQMHRFMWLLVAMAATSPARAFSIPSAKIAQVLREAGLNDETLAESFVDGKPEWLEDVTALLNGSISNEKPLSSGQESKDAPIRGTLNIILANGYPAEEHIVRTEDGYLLTAFRVPNPGQPVVYLMHGILESSADWLAAGKERALGFRLHDAGYDVWMGNARGTTPSRRHETLQPSDPRFWDFSWHEIGERDLPATIDYVLANTNQTALHYVGHSQGTTTFLVMGSERSEYMNKIKTYIALAPVGFPRDIRSVPLRLLAYARSSLQLLRLIGGNEFLPNSWITAKLSEMLCSTDDITQPVCSNILFLICGRDTEQEDKDLLPQILANTPAGAATKQLIHYGQLVDQKDLVFRKYDYGAVENLVRYKQLTPPDYDLSRVTATTYLFHSDNDILAVQSNIDELVRTLPNIAADDGVHRVPLSVFNHLDFLFARDVNPLVNDHVLNIIKKQEAALVSSQQ